MCGNEFIAGGQDGDEDGADGADACAADFGEQADFGGADFRAGFEDDVAFARERRRGA